MPWVYDPRLGGSGYRDTTTGHVLSNAEAQGLIDGFIASGTSVGNSLAELFANGQISPSDWEGRMREEIKDQYIAQYLEGIGGREKMTPSDWGSVGGMLSEQYGYLGGFMEDLEGLTEGQIAMRSAMYMNSSREAYERARLKAADGRGYTEKAWSLGYAEHCDDCVYLASLGYIPVEDPFIAPSSGQEAIPGSGDTLCITNCQCVMEYR